MTKQISLITGSTRGIGKQIGIDLLNQGHFVIFTGNNISSIQLLKKELEEKYTNFKVYKVDFSHQYLIGDFCEDLIKDFKKIDNVICNVGCTCRKSFNDITMEEWDKVFNMNLKYPVFMLKYISNIITKRIIFIGSILGSIPNSKSIAYGVSKGSLEILTKYLAKEFSYKNITVNNIAPGFVMTDWHSSKCLEQIQKSTDEILLHRFADTSEISHACKFIIENDYITGQTINIDGGYAL